MKERQISEFQIVTYEKWLRQQEKSLATIKKYCRDVRLFQTYVGEQMVTKNLVIEYKQWLVRDGYAPNSINSMLASVNGLFVCLGWDDCRVKNVRIQREVYCPECRELSKKEYVRLIEVAKRKGNHRMSLLLQTVCSTGIRISELQYITVEALKKGEVSVFCKGKIRKIFLVSELQKMLEGYARKNKIVTGPIFVTNRGNPMDRSNIWREMKGLCEEAGVGKQKVMPHSLRHLFARTFYEQDKDIAKLADVLGHASINTTRIYIMRTEEEHKRCMEKLQLTI